MTASPEGGGEHRGPGLVEEEEDDDEEEEESFRVYGKGTVE